MNTRKTLLALSLVVTTLTGCRHGGETPDVEELVTKIEEGMTEGGKAWDCLHNMEGIWQAEGGYCEVPLSIVAPDLDTVLVDPTLSTRPNAEPALNTYIAPKKSDTIDDAFTSLAAFANVPMEVLKPICLSDQMAIEDVPALTCRIAKDEQGEEKAVIVGVHVEETPTAEGAETDQTDYTIQVINLTDRTVNVRVVTEYDLYDTKNYFLAPLISSGYDSDMDVLEVATHVNVEGSVEGLGNRYTASYEWSVDLEANRDAIINQFQTYDNISDSVDSVFRVISPSSPKDDRLYLGRFRPWVMKGEDLTEQGLMFLSPVTYDASLKPLFISSWLYF